MTTRVLVLCKAYDLHVTNRLVEAAHALGIALDLVLYRDVHLAYNGTFLTIDTGQGTRDLRDYSHYIFRGPATYTSIKNAILSAVAVKARVLNLAAHQQYFGNANKMVEMVRLSEAGLPLIPTRIAATQEGLAHNIDETLATSKGAILKPIGGGGGGGIHLVTNASDTPPVAKPQQTLVQDYLLIEHDYRVLVMGYKVLGVMRRTIPDGQFVSNVEQGGIVDEGVLSDEVRELAVKAARVMPLEFTGVDILMQDQTPYILEANAMTDFKGFEQATGQDVAKALLIYLLSTPNEHQRQSKPRHVLQQQPKKTFGNF